MIILMGPMADPVLANVCARLAVRNADLMLVHPESEGQDWDVSWSTGGGMVVGRIRLGRRVIDAASIDAVYLRGVGARSSSTREIESSRRRSGNSPKVFRSWSSTGARPGIQTCRSPISNG